MKKLLKTLGNNWTNQKLLENPSGKITFKENGQKKKYRTKNYQKNQDGKKLTLYIEEVTSLHVKLKNKTLQKKEEKKLAYATTLIITAIGIVNNVTSVTIQSYTRMTLQKIHIVPVRNHLMS